MPAKFPPAQRALVAIFDLHAVILCALREIVVANRNYILFAGRTRTRPLRAITGHRDEICPRSARARNHAEVVSRVVARPNRPPGPCSTARQPRRRLRTPCATC